jgi:hypothetical protein
LKDARSRAKQLEEFFIGTRSWDALLQRSYNYLPLSDWLDYDGAVLSLVKIPCSGKASSSLMKCVWDYTATAAFGSGEGHENAFGQNALFQGTVKAKASCTGDT